MDPGKVRVKTSYQPKNHPVLSIRILDLRLLWHKQAAIQKLSEHEIAPHRYFKIVSGVNYTADQNLSNMVLRARIYF